MTRAAALAFVLAPALASAQPSARPTSLADFEGTYAYHGSTSLAIVPADTLLFAVIDEAKYPLRPLGGDRFLNGSGDTIPFRRAADGVVSGFVERSVFFARRTPVVDSATAADVRTPPRPLGADGRAVPYAYVAPADVGDGLQVGDLTEAGFDTAGVARLMNRVIDGTYPGVHGVLVYRGRRLVVEEYFHAYDRERPHQMRSLTKSVVSALVGIAIDRGAIGGDTARVGKHLPY